jgi:hypothetical protein
MMHDEEPRGKGLMGTLLRYPYEVRDEADYVDDIPNLKIEKEMRDLAKHIMQTKSGHFEPCARRISAANTGRRLLLLISVGGVATSEVTVVRSVLRAPGVVSAAEPVPFVGMVHATSISEEALIRRHIHMSDTP